MSATGASTSRTSGTSISSRSATRSPIRPRTTRRTQCGRYLGYTAVNVIEFGAESEYHGLQARLTRRFGQNFTANVGYTLSKALDHVDADNNAIGYSFDLDREWGPSGLDRRHQVTIDYVYQLPNAGTKWLNNAVGRVLLDGWQIAGISRFWSGQPLTITSNGNPGTTGGGRARRLPRRRPVSR